MGIVLVICMLIILIAGLYLIRLHKNLKEANKLNDNLHTKYTEQTKEFYEQRLQMDGLFKEINCVSENNAKISKEYSALTDKYYKDIKDIRLLSTDALDKLQATYDRELSARKSSEVRVGQISEQILPFLSAWPFDPKNFRFSGDPIDGISYEDDRVVFVEIKTGKSRLSKRQENIKKLVKEGKVEFITIRINEEGILVK